MNRLVVLRTIFLAITCLASTAVNAGIITVKFDGFSHGKTRVYQTLDGTSRNANAGMFDLNVVSANGVANWLAEQRELEAFCVEIDQYLTTRRNVAYKLMTGEAFFNNAKTLDMVGRLYTGFFQSVKAQTTAKNKRIYSTAFQLALWELVYDANTPDLLDDRYEMRANKNGTVRTKANEFLAGLSGVTNQYSIYVLQSDSSQDLLIVNPVPPKVSEPTTLATLSLALLVLARRSFKK